MSETKRRGAQPGNLNAMRHGYYSRYMSDLEMTDLDSVAAGLESEIAMLRVQTRRFLSLLQSATDLDVDQATRALSALGASAQRIARLIQINRVVAGQDDEVTAAQREALRRVYLELGL